MTPVYSLASTREDQRAGTVTALAAVSGLIVMSI